MTPKPALQEILRRLCEWNVVKATKDQKHHHKHESSRQHNDMKSISLNNHSECEWTKCPYQTHRVSEWIKKQNPSICCLQETYLRHEDTIRLKVRGYSSMYYATGSQKKAGVAILRSDK